MLKNFFCAIPPVDLETSSRAQETSKFSRGVEASKLPLLRITLLWVARGGWEVVPFLHGGRLSCRERVGREMNGVWI